MRKLYVFIGFCILLFGCDYQSDNQENDIEVSGQAARVYFLNSFRRELSTFDFCIWFDVKNTGSKDLIFDAIEVKWLFAGGFFDSRGTPGKGKRYIIPPGKSKQFSFSTLGSGVEFVRKYGDKFVNVMFTLVALKNRERVLKKFKNAKPEDISPDDIDIETFGPFLSSVIPPLFKLPVGSESDKYKTIENNKYYSIEFTLVDNDFSVKDLDGVR